MLPSSATWQDIYPGMRGAGVSKDARSTTINASAPGPKSPPTAPAIVLIAAVVLLIVIRVVYDAAPSGGKGL